MKTLIFSSILAFITFSASAQVKASIRVAGNCDMCKKRIENAADLKGVKTARWDSKTQLLEINYNPNKISLIQIQEEIAKIGHDTEKFKADSLAFEKLHNCCHYERFNYDESKD